MLVTTLLLRSVGRTLGVFSGINHVAKICVCVGLLLAPVNAFSAETIAFDSTNHGANAILGDWQGSSSGVEIMLAQRFDLSRSGRVSELVLGLTFLSQRNDVDNVDELTLAIVPDNDGLPSDLNLWQESYFNQATTGGLSQNSIFPVSNGPELVSGDKYWLTTRSTSVGFRPHVWWSSDDFSNEPRAQKYIRGDSIFPEDRWLIPFQGRGNSRTLRVVVVPEPSGTALLALVTANFAIARRKRSK